MEDKFVFNIWLSRDFDYTCHLLGLEDSVCQICFALLEEDRWRIHLSSTFCRSETRRPRTSQNVTLLENLTITLCPGRFWQIGLPNFGWSLLGPREGGGLDCHQHFARSKLRPHLLCPIKTYLLQNWYPFCGIRELGFCSFKSQRKWFRRINVRLISSEVVFCMQNPTHTLLERKWKTLGCAAR